MNFGGRMEERIWGAGGQSTLFCPSAEVMYAAVEESKCRCSGGLLEVAGELEGGGRGY